VHRIDKCLSQIAAIRDVAAGQAPPYVARSRIGRLALSVSVLVAEEAGISVPDLPRPIRVPAEACAQLCNLAAQCNRLSQLARHIAQPSEPLDDRWRRGWQQLLRELDGLDETLQKMQTPAPSNARTPSASTHDPAANDLAPAVDNKKEPSPSLDVAAD